MYECIFDVELHCIVLVEARKKKMNRLQQSEVNSGVFIVFLLEMVTEPLLISLLKKRKLVCDH